MLYNKGKLVIITGPDGVGKEPLIKAFEGFINITGFGFYRHKLYTDRGMDDGTFNLCTTKELIAFEADGDYHVYTIQGEQRIAINLEELRRELSNFDYVLLDIRADEIPFISDFCRQHGFEMKRICASPLSEQDLDALGCDTDEKRAVAIKAAVFTKLINRGSEPRISIEQTAAAADEILSYGKQDDILFVNRYGEENAELWDALSLLYGTHKGLEMMSMFDDFIKFMEDTGEYHE